MRTKDKNLAALLSHFTITSEQPDYSWYDLFGRPRMNYSFEFSCDSREAYQEFRKAWRTEYAALSRLIRFSRTAFRQRHRLEEGMDAWRASWPAVRAFSEERELSRTQLEDEALNWDLKKYARFLLALRQAAKSHSAECRKRARQDALAA